MDNLKEENGYGVRRFLKKNEALYFKVISLAILVAVWWVLSLFFPDSIFPGPIITLATLWNNLVTGTLMVNFVATMIRVISGFFLAMVFGVVIGTVMGIYHKAELFLDLWVMTALTIPGLIYTIVSFLWFGLNETATVIAITVTTVPAISISVWEGVKNVNTKLIDMAKIFDASRNTITRKVILPQIYPYIMSSCRYGIGIIWKVTVVVELLGRSSGIGYELNLWFSLYNMPQVFSWCLFFIVIMLIIEVVIFKQIENSLFKWRPKLKM